MIELAILGLLSEQELHGYELRKRVAAVLGPGRSGLSFGSLYPALNRMERSGLVKTVEPANDNSRSTGWSSGSLSGELAAFRTRRSRAPRPSGGRSRKVYGLTDAGRAHLEALLTDAGPVDERTFALQVAFCRLLAPSARLELFHRRRTELGARLRELGDGPDDGLPFTHRYLRVLREHDIETINCDLAWLDRLIADEQAQVDREEQPTR
jgi:DNA-binding PadR family transcriptional regulator